MGGHDAAMLGKAPQSDSISEDEVIALFPNAWGIIEGSEDPDFGTITMQDLLNLQIWRVV